MPLNAFVRRAALFFRNTWLGRALLRPASPSPRTTPPPTGSMRRPLKPALEVVEARETPNDLFGLLATGYALGGLPLLSGRVATPLSAFFVGWGKNPKAAEAPPADLPRVPFAPDGKAWEAPALPPARPETFAARGEALRTGYLAPSGGGRFDFLNEFASPFGAPPVSRHSGLTYDAEPQHNGGGGPGSQPEFAAPPVFVAGFSPAGDAPASAGPNVASDAPASQTPVLSGGSANTVVGPTINGDSVNPDGSSGGGTVVNPDGGLERAANASVASAYGRTALPFEVNFGQAEDGVLARSRGPGFGFWATAGGMTFSVARPAQEGDAREPAGRDVFRLNLADASASPEVVGTSQLRARANYFAGSDPSAWQTNVPQYAAAELRGVWAGVDLVMRSSTPDDRAFEYDFRVAPGADPAVVRLSAEGANASLDRDGRLLLRTGGGTVVQEAPRAWTVDAVGGRAAVQVSYALRDDGTVGFALGGYDASRTLVIDPVISFGSYLGGSGDDKAYAVAVDAAGNSYVTGETAGSGFPSTAGFLPGGSGDVFVAKLNAAGTELVYSAVLGGTGADAGNGIAVDAAGNAYVTGSVASAATSGFPTTPGAYQTAATVGTAVFAAKLGAAGDALLYSTFVSGTAGDLWGAAIDVDADGYAYVAGRYDGKFAPPSGPAHGGPGGTQGAFVAVLAPAGDALAGAATLTGHDFGSATGVAADGAGGFYVTGFTDDTSFPATGGAYDTTHNGGYDAYAAKLGRDCSAVLYGTFLGGQYDDYGYAVDVDALGRVAVAGSTTHDPGRPGVGVFYPTAGGAYQTAIAGGTDAFATVLDPALSALTYSTYLGGSGDDAAHGVRLDAAGRAVVAGRTASTNFPTLGAFQGSNAGGTDAFLTRLTPTGTLSYSTYLGGTGTDEARGAALDPRGRAYLAGLTNSSGMSTGGSYQPSNAGGYDAFVAKVLPTPDAPRFTSISSDSGNSSTDFITTDQTLTITGTATPNATVTLERAGVGVIGSTTANAFGTFTYDYTATTLPEGTYAFTARASDAGGTSDFADPELIVQVDRTAPTVNVYLPATTPSRGPEVRVTARDRYGVPAATTVTLDVDLNNDGDFLDASEAAFATATLTDGYAFVKLPDLGGTGTYRVRAGVADTAGNTGTSSASTFTVSANTSWASTGSNAVSADPLAADMLTQLGDVSVAHPLDLDRSPGTSRGGSPALVYRSSQVSQKPIVQLRLPSANNAALPSAIDAQLTFNGTTAATVTYSTTGFRPGDVFTLALQASNAVTTTGRYGWSVLVKVSGQADQTITGAAYVVAQDSSALGAGWSIAGVDRLVSIAADANGPAGVMRVYGSGGYRFYEGTSTFTSPAGDNGTLALSGGTYTYSTPDGSATTFDNNGYQKRWDSADGKESLQYRYDGSNRLTGVTAIDGALTTLTYTGSASVGIAVQGARTTTLTLSSGRLGSVTNPDGGLRTFTYDGSSRLTRDQNGLLENNWAYTTYGTVGTMTWGATTAGSATNTSRTVVSPVAVQGLGALVSGTVFGKVTDPLGRISRVETDDRGRVVQAVSADGSSSGTAYTNGYVTSSTDAIGRTTTYTRDAAGYVTKVTYPDLTSVTYDYQTAFHALTTVTNERGYSTTYAYDASGRNTGSTDALGNRTTNVYDSSTGLLQNTIDARGNTSTMAYDAARRLTAATNAKNETTTYTYDAHGNVETTTDALGRVTTAVNDAMGRTTAGIDALGNRATMAYDAASGLSLWNKDALNTVGTVVYDPFMRGLATQNVQGYQTGVQSGGLTTFDDLGRAKASRTPTGWTSETQFDAVGAAVSGTDALGHRTGYTETDALGRTVSSRDSMGRLTAYSYDQRDRVETTTDALGRVSTSVYDEAGNNTVRIDNLGRRTTAVFDALNRQTNTIDPLGRRTTTTFDPAGNVATSSDHMGRVTSYAYDELNRATRTTVAVGTGAQVTTSVAFDAVGNTSSTTDGRGKTTAYSYDAVNRQTVVTDALANRTTTTYNAVGSVDSVRDALNKVVTYGYDALHRQVSTLDQVGNRTTAVLDAGGASAASLDGLGKLTVAATDANGRSVGNLDSLGGFGYTLYAGDGSTRAFTDPVGNEWKYGYDDLGRQSTVADPFGKVTTTAYDSADRVSQVTDRNGRVMAYGYDNADRNTGVTWKTSAGVTVNLQTFVYDDNDNVTSAADNAGTVAYSYDEQNRITSNTNVFGQILTFTYDGNNNVTLRQDSFGGVLTSVYDDNNRLTSRRHGGASQTEVRFDFAYTNRNEPSSVTRYSDVAGTTLVGTTAWSRDDAGRLTEILTRNGSNTVLSSYTYAYDSASRVTTHGYTSTLGTTTYSGTKTYAYDTTDQLTNDTTATYTYDANGNRTMAGYATGTANRMTNDGTFTYTYDDSGNTTQKSKGSGLETWFYAWDNANRLTNVTKTSNGSTVTLSVTYTYDVEGRRVQEAKWKTGVGSTTTRFAWDGQNLWADTDGTNALTVRYVQADGIDTPLARVVTSGVNAGLGFYVQDNIGSVRDLLDSTGAVLEHNEYSGFGEVISYGAGSESEYKYLGARFDESTGLVTLKGGEYIPNAGVYLGEFGLALMSGSNLYKLVSADVGDAKPAAPAVLGVSVAKPERQEARTGTKEEINFNKTHGTGFKHETRWTPPAKSEGLIIQKVIMSNTIVSKMPEILAEKVTYWELWFVKDGKVYTDKPDGVSDVNPVDTFRTSHEQRGTKGKISISGEAIFVPGKISDLFVLSEKGTYNGKEVEIYSSTAKTQLFRLSGGLRTSPVPPQAWTTNVNKPGVLKHRHSLTVEYDFYTPGKEVPAVAVATP